MSGGQQALLQAITRAASEIPTSTLRSVAQGIAAIRPERWEQGRQHVLDLVPAPRLRHVIAELMEAWRAHAPSLTAEAVSLAVLSASDVAEHARSATRIEATLTGPAVADVPLRRTDQALLEVIGAATQELIIVSFAVYNLPEISEALVAAANRSVKVRICLDAPDPDGTTVAYDTLRALGQQVRDRAEIYLWPVARRPVGPRGKPALLHAKFAVADERALYLSSANLTSYAMNLNIEAGVLIYGGQTPRRFTRYINALIREGIFTPVT